jgi:filamentous hemagglutinin
MMLQRLNTALGKGEKLTGADANFYIHELTEAGLMEGGIGAEAAHNAAIKLNGFSPYSLYDPEVIQANPNVFNDNWLDYWGVK